MIGFILASIYVALFAFLPLLLVTAKTLSVEKLRDRVFRKALIKDYLRTFPTVALVLLPMAIFSQYIRPLIVILHLIFVVPLALELGHVWLFGTRIGLNTFYSLFVSNARETREFVAQNVSFVQCFAFVSLLVLPLLFLFKLPNVIWPSVWWRVSICISLFVLTIPFWLNFRRKPSKRKDGYILNPYVNIIYGYFQFRTQYRSLRKLVAKHSAMPFSDIVSSLPIDEPQTYVIVIGESSNAMHHSYCGYSRNTNEFTDRLGDSMLRFVGVRSLFSQTIPSLEKTITFADTRHPDLMWERGSLVDYFHDAGFETYWLSNQYALDDTALTAMTAHADVNKCYNFGGMKRFEKAGLDGSLLPDFAKFIRSGKKKKVLFLHLIGSHSAYVNRYPDEFRCYSGQLPGRHLISAQMKLLNSYDDSIRYTDWVISKLVVELESVPCASYLLYFSDHGEDIYDSRDDRVLGHSQLANIPMTSIPFMFWLSPKLEQLRPDIRSRALKSSAFVPAGKKVEFDGVERYNLQNAIHFILDVSSLSNSDYDPSQSLLNLRGNS